MVIRTLHEPSGWASALLSWGIRQLWGWLQGGSLERLPSCTSNAGTQFVYKSKIESMTNTLVIKTNKSCLKRDRNLPETFSMQLQGPSVSSGVQPAWKHQSSAEGPVDGMIQQNLKPLLQLERVSSDSTPSPQLWTGTATPGLTGSKR